MSDVNEKWQSVLEAVPYNLKFHFADSTAAIGPSGLIVSLPSAGANLHTVQAIIEPRFLRAKIDEIFGKDIAVHYQTPLLDMPEPEPAQPEPVQTSNVLPKGFTPIVDSLVTEIGLIPAAIYGVIWRHCQMSSRTCYASQKTIAKRLDLSRECVNRKIKTLQNDGYIRCLNEKEKGATKVYITTNKVSITIGLTMTAESQ